MAIDTRLVQDLRDELTCPLCSEYFKDPVKILECGHSFCRVCLYGCSGSATEGTCPQCRRTFRWGKIGPNRQLANIVEMVRKLIPRGAEGTEGVCEQHGEPRNLFCREDKTLICVTCEHRDHRDHETLLLEDAAQEYRDRISNHLDAFKVKKEKMSKRKGDKERESQDHFEQMKKKREKIVMGIRQLCQFLVEKVKEMEDAEKEIKRERENYLEKLSEDLQSLESVIQETEKKLHQPAMDLLQDIEKFMERCQEAQSSEDSTVFNWSILDMSDVSFLLEGVMEQIQDISFSGLLKDQLTELDLSI